jgi:lactate dehydrogenase-like 2-hydroxyacid dehydrogenase
MAEVAVVVISNIPSLASLFRHYLDTTLSEHVSSIHVFDYSALDHFPTVQDLKNDLAAYQRICFLADPSRISSTLNDIDFIDLCRSKHSTWLQSTWAGIESVINTKAIQENALVLTRVGGIFGQQMAEYVLGMIINKERQFQKLAQNQLQHVWDKICDYRKLNQLTIGIMGAGDIGSFIAKSAKLGFNMRVRPTIR